MQPDYFSVQCDSMRTEANCTLNDRGIAETVFSYDITDYSVLQNGAAFTVTNSSKGPGRVSVYNQIA